MCLHLSVSLNNEKNCREISEDKIAVCEKTAGLRSGNSSDLDSACLKALVPVEIFQFSDMHYESRFLDTFRGHNIRANRIGLKLVIGHQSQTMHQGHVGKVLAFINRCLRMMPTIW